MKKVFVILVLLFVAFNIEAQVSPRSIFHNTRKLPTFDTDAQTFITTYSITDNTQKNAINTLVLAFKAAGSAWSKIYIYCPIVGGNATAHRGNLKTSTNALTFFGSWTHSANGALSDGSTGYANISFGLDNYSSFSTGNGIGIYKTGGQSGGWDLGNLATAPFHRIVINTTGNGGNAAQNAGDGLTESWTQTSGDAGWFYMQRTTTTNVEMFFNATTKASFTTSTADPTTGSTNFTLADQWTGGGHNFQAASYRGILICEPLTDAEELAVYNAIQTFNTSLSRQL